MSMRLEARLWVVQRATAFVLAACVAVHLVTIVLVVRGGLGAADILARTRGHAGWAIGDGPDGRAAASHGAIGRPTGAREWSGWHRGVGAAATGVALALMLLGWRAVAAVVLA